MARNSWGSVRKLPSGKFQARYCIDYVWHTAPATFRTKKEADSFLAGMRADLDRGVWLDPGAGKVSLADYSARWIRERPQLRPRTVELYEGLLRNHINPALGATQLNQLTSARVREWRATMLRAGKPGATAVAKCYRLLHAIFNTAVEDDLIGYSRVKHFSTKDDTWLVRLAMVKSGVRALDAIQEFMRTRGANVDRFVVSGGSKRGWTAWLVGVTDRRVVALMPMVIDALNSEAITRHHYEAYGFFSPALKDYVEHGLFPGKIGTPEYRAVLRIEDPYEHRARLRMPKYLVNASGDEFFLPDNSQFYFDALEGEKHLRYVPNAKHNLAGSDARESLTAYYQSVLDGKPRPKFTWKKNHADGSLRVEVKDRPAQVNLWQAANPQARDFRVDVIGHAYTSSVLAETGPGIYEARVPSPAQGYQAFFVELVYPSGGKYPFKFTTEVSVVPDVLPFKWKSAVKKFSPSQP